MQKFMETIIHAVKSWVRHDAFTADDAIELVAEMDIIELLRAVDGTIYTSPNGEIYTL
jgi:hypothetical protein